MFLQLFPLLQLGHGSLLLVGTTTEACFLQFVVVPLISKGPGSSYSWNTIRRAKNNILAIIQRKLFCNAPGDPFNIILNITLKFLKIKKIFKSPMKNWHILKKSVFNPRPISQNSWKSPSWMAPTNNAAILLTLIKKCCFETKKLKCKRLEKNELVSGDQSYVF